MMFDREEGYNEASGVNRDWPDGRGVFFNTDRSLGVQVNKEDHIRVISIVRPTNEVQDFSEAQKVI